MDGQGAEAEDLDPAVGARRLGQDPPGAVATAVINENNLIITIHCVEDRPDRSELVCRE